MTRDRPHSTLATLFSVVVIDLIGFGVVIPILPFYARDYGASAAVLGLLLTSYAVAQAVFAPLWGRLSDRIGRRPVLLLTIAGTSVALFILGLADSLAWLFIARILGGIFGANVSVATAYITDVTAESERTRWMGLLGASFGVGFVLGPAIGGALSPLGYDVPMLVAGGLAALNCLFAGFVLREPPAHRAAPAAGFERLRLPANLLVRKLCLAYFVFSFGVSQLETVFAFFMLDRFGYDAHHVATILVLMAVVMGGVQGGAVRPLSQRLGERGMLIAGTILLSAAFLAVPAIPVVWLLVTVLAISAVGRGVSHPALLSMVSSAAEPERRGSVMGTFQSSASLARVVGPTVAGALYDAHPGVPFLLAAGLMLGVLVIAVTLPSAGHGA